MNVFTKALQLAQPIAVSVEGVLSVIAGAVVGFFKSFTVGVITLSGIAEALVYGAVGGISAYYGTLAVKHLIRLIGKLFKRK